MHKEAQQFTFADISVGHTASFTQIISEDLVRSFAELSGDHSPLHIDKEYARTTSYGKTIAHGMIAGMLFSRMVGMELPGKNGVYLSQQLHFRAPVIPGDEVTVSGEIIQKSEAIRAITVMLRMHNQKQELCVDGAALVKLLI